jgi:starvation-inducible DNA-binding protein
MNKELIDALNKVLADTFVMYYKAHASHWNITGSNFPQYHSFLKKLYKELFAAVDDIAEQIRMMDAYTPSSLAELMSNTMVTENVGTMSPEDHFSKLLDANNLVLASLMMAYKEAENATEIGLSNFIQDRVMAHQKHGWMLKAITK